MALVVKHLLANTGNVEMKVWFPESGRCPGEKQGNPLQYSCLENPMDRGAWQATVRRVAKNWTWLKWLNVTNVQHAFVNCFGFISVDLPPLLLFYSLVVWWLYLKLQLHSFIFFVSISIIDFWFVLTMKIYYNNLSLSLSVCICIMVLSSWSLNFKCI